MVTAYLRISTERQHIENQQGEIIRYASDRGITVDRWVTEIVSGKTDRKKRKLGRVVNRLKKNDILIVTELSRLSRSLHEIMQIMKYCVENQVEIHSTKDGYVFDDSINSKVLSFAFGLAAEIEHKLISQRTREAMALRKAEGKHMGRKKGSNVKLQFLEKRKTEIKAQLAKGKTIMAICRDYEISYNTFYRFRQANPDIGGGR
ncbi:MAG: recombinase family protein [Bacteroidales bacterium]|nr:recombinase family protein [Bacteroidales bacterium]